LIITGVLYFIKTFKYKRSNIDDVQEDDNLFDASNSIIRPSISTQTSSMGTSTLPVHQEINPKQ
jgi:hypothetical protein